MIYVQQRRKKKGGGERFLIIILKYESTQKHLVIHVKIMYVWNKETLSKGIFSMPREEKEQIKNNLKPVSC